MCLRVVPVTPPTRNTPNRDAKHATAFATRGICRVFNDAGRVVQVSARHRHGGISARKANDAGRPEQIQGAARADAAAAVAALFKTITPLFGNLV